MIERKKIYLYKDEVFKLYTLQNGILRRGNPFSKENIYIIEETLLGTRKNEFGGVLRVTNWELIKDVFFLCVLLDVDTQIYHFVRVKEFNLKRIRVLYLDSTKTDSPVSVPVNFISGNIFKKYSGGKKLDQTLFPKLSNQKFNKGLNYYLRI